jgi:hypothetical protein
MPASTGLFVSSVRTYGPRMMRDLGLTAEQCAGIFGNIGHECNGMHEMQEVSPRGGGRGGAGWLQETGPRRRKFEAWLVQHGYVVRGRPNIGHPEGNYRYIVKETSTDERSALAALKRCRTVEAATNSFMINDERPGIRALNSRIRWANIAYRELRDELKSPSPSPAPPQPQPLPVVAKPNTGGDTDTDKKRPTPIPVSKVGDSESEDDKTATPPISEPIPQPSGFWKHIEHLFGHTELPPVTLPPAAAQIDPPSKPAGYDPVVARVQKALSDRGYTEVGMVDGLFGDRTMAGIRTAQFENGMVETGVIDDKFLAALPKLPVRSQTSRRSGATAQDLRDAGNKVVAHSDNLRKIGGGFSILGLLGGVGSTGLFDNLQNVLGQAGDTTTRLSDVLTSLQNAIVIVASVFRWFVDHWWIFALIGGFAAIIIAVLIVEDMVIKFRQAFLTRPN